MLLVVVALVPWAGAGPEAPEAPEAIEVVPTGPSGQAGSARRGAPAASAAGPARRPRGTPAAATTTEECDRAFYRGASDDAARCYTARLTADGGSAETEYRLGLAVAAQGDLSGAGERWRRALRRDPEHVGASRALTRLRLAEAVGRGLPGPAEAAQGERLLERVRALAAQRRCALAVELLREAGGDGRGPELAVLEGECLLSLGRVAEAEAALVSALGLGPWGPAAASGLARAAGRRGDAAAASYYEVVAQSLQRGEGSVTPQRAPAGPRSR